MGKLAILSVAVAALSVLIGERFVNLSKRHQIFREVVNNHLPNCVALKNIEHGSEDITIMENGLAFISTGLTFLGLPNSDSPGKIYTLDMNNPSAKPVELRMPRDFDLESFNPHGISIYTDPADDSVYLYVVNHPQHNSQIELFKYVEDNLSLVHIKTIKHDLLHSVNDIVAVGVESFYATIDQYFSNPILSQFELLVMLPWKNVVYYSPTEVKIVSEGYYFPNGINISPDKKHVYVADILDHKIHVLERKQDNGLTFVKAVAVHSLCDNIEVDPETGDLWVGSHPNAKKLFLFDPKDPPGSEIIRIQNIHSDKPVLSQVYADDGHVLMGSSVATVFGGKLLIGSVFHKALLCDLK